MSSRHNKLRCPTCWRYPPPRIRVSTCLDCQACWPTATRPAVPLFSMSLRMVSSLRGPIGHLIGTCCLRSKVSVKFGPPQWNISRGSIPVSACIRRSAIAAQRSSNGRRMVLHSRVCNSWATSTCPRFSHVSASTWPPVPLTCLHGADRAPSEAAPFTNHSTSGAAAVCRAVRLACVNDVRRARRFRY